MNSFLLVSIYLQTCFFLFTNHYFLTQDFFLSVNFSTHLIYCFYERFLFEKSLNINTCIFGSKIVFNTHNRSVIYMNMILIYIFLYEKNMIWQTKIFIRTEGVRSKNFYVFFSHKIFGNIINKTVGFPCLFDITFQIVCLYNHMFIWNTWLSPNSNNLKNTLMNTDSIY